MMIADSFELQNLSTYMFWFFPFNQTHNVFTIALTSFTSEVSTVNETSLSTSKYTQKHELYQKLKYC